jgi:hypothetical protein
LTTPEEGPLCKDLDGSCLCLRHHQWGRLADAQQLAHGTCTRQGAQCWLLLRPRLLLDLLLLLWLLLELLGQILSWRWGQRVVCVDSCDMQTAEQQKVTTPAQVLGSFLDA